MFRGLTLAYALFVCSCSGPAADDVGKPTVEVLQPDPGWKKLGRNLWFDPKAKKVILRARVVLREGYLEHFMCSKGTKEHEVILTADCDAEVIHAALLAAGGGFGLAGLAGAAFYFCDDRGNGSLLRHRTGVAKCAHGRSRISQRRRKGVRTKRAPRAAAQRPGGLRNCRGVCIACHGGTTDAHAWPFAGRGCGFRSHERDLDEYAAIGSALVELSRGMEKARASDPWAPEMPWVAS